MRVLLAQLNPTIGDLSGNLDKILKAIQFAKEKKCDLVVTSELAITGYPPEDFLLLENFVDATVTYLDPIIEASKGIGVIVGTIRKNPDEEGKPLFNSAAICFNGKLLGFQDKILLPTYDVFDERRYFESGKKDKPWKIGSYNIGITVCEDIWHHSRLSKEIRYSKDPIVELSKDKIDLHVNLSASPYHVGKLVHRMKVVEQAAMTLNCPTLLCNQVGGNDSLIFDGHSISVNSQGELIAYGKGFEEDLLVVDTAQNTIIHPEEDPLENLYKALVLGIRDYFRKSGFAKACVGLSGGIDSALVACLAVEALGASNVLGVFMPSRFTSDQSRIDAEALAKNLNIPLKNIPIEKPFQSFLDLLTPHFEGIPPNVTEENIQARIRGIILMALSNKLGLIVLSTGNKSELALGYATLYGDMCGGLAVINDLSKEQVYALSLWINSQKTLIPESSLTKDPTAELRPNQKDTDSLPEYPIVDAVLRGYIEQGLSPEEIAKGNFLPFELVQDLVRKIHTNEYKRRQSAPGLRVTEKAFSVGRRFPIVQKWV